jgi:ABC-type multidrug transport system ATPase subunit
VFVVAGHEERPGEVFGVPGPNGSGKSALIRVIPTIVLLDDGQVAVFGQGERYGKRTGRPKRSG